MDNAQIRLKSTWNIQETSPTPVANRPRILLSLKRPLPPPITPSPEHSPSPQPSQLPLSQPGSSRPKDAKPDNVSATILFYKYRPAPKGKAKGRAPEKVNSDTVFIRSADRHDVIFKGQVLDKIGQYLAQRHVGPTRVPLKWSYKVSTIKIGYNLITINLTFQSIFA